MLEYIKSKIKHNSYLFEYLYSALLCSLVLFFTIFGSYWLNIYSNDPQHFGNMLSSAKDLSNGYLPYKDVFILYGLLTTIIHAIAFTITGNLFSIIFVTSLIYGIGLILLYFLALEVTKSIKLSTFILITIFLFHPFIVLPWSNYIAFPLIILGFIGLSNNKISITKIFFSGVSFGLAILAREGLIVPISLILLAYIFIDFRLKNLKFYFALFFGAISPLILLFVYLYKNNLIDYWYQTSIILPKLYKDAVFHDASFKGASLFFYDLLKKSLHPDFRWFLVSVMFGVNFLIILNALFNKRFFDKKLESNIIMLLCISSFFFISSSLHIKQIFRIATGSIVGIIPFYYFLDKQKKYNLNLIFFFVIFTLSTTLFKQNSGIHDFPNKERRLASEEVISPKYLAGQKLPKKTIQYYQSIDSDLQRIKGLQCGIRYSYNYTRDAFLQVISPFEKYQVAPSFIGGGGIDVELLRPDLNIADKIKLSKDVIFFYIPLDPDHYKNNPFPKNYLLFSSYDIPEAMWIEPGQKLSILVPDKCLKSN